MRNVTTYRHCLSPLSLLLLFPSLGTQRTATSWFDTLPQHAPRHTQSTLHEGDIQPHLDEAYLYTHTWDTCHYDWLNHSTNPLLAALQRDDETTKAATNWPRHVHEAAKDTQHQQTDRVE
jgi:hypothetical protein